MSHTSTAADAHQHTTGEKFRHFLHLESSGGVFLVLATIIALILANSPAAELVADFWHAHAVVQVGPVTVDETLHHWINDALMSVFFLVAGLEIKRELVAGELRDPKRAALPAVAAIGGMVVPALIYTLINVGGDGANGWGVPLATDIAFAVAVLAIVGKGLPSGLKVFLLSLAIADDIGAVVVIALFYSSSISFTWLGIAGGFIAIVMLMKRVDIWFVPAYVLVGFGFWLAMFESGVHATLAGVILGLMAPAVARRPDPTHVDVEATTPFAVLREVLVDAKETVPVTDRLIHILHPWTAFVVLPLFALANGGVAISGSGLADAAASPVTLGIVFGLVAGKTIGIVFATRIAVSAGLGSLPDGVTWTAVTGVALLAGIGFTVSLFITGLAFHDPVTQDNAKIGVLTPSVLAAGLGSFVLRKAAADAAADAPVEAASAEEPTLV
ncbi:MAG: Na+/H+ antiporter NhaA [Acidimicrobiales bacterium]|nr:Na+/H+ antiporter NhaA [Acidimicrobiales bacterium]